MNASERIQIIRLMEKMKKDHAYSQKLGLKNESHWNTEPKSNKKSIV